MEQVRALGLKGSLVAEWNVSDNVSVTIQLRHIKG